MNELISSSESSFILNDSPFRFIGANMYELANVDSAVTESMFREAAGEGFKVIRFWAFHPTTKEKLTEIFELAKSYKLYVIPVLADTTGYLQSFSISSDWYRTEYKNIYLPYVKEITSAFKDRHEILLWEIINEPYTDSFNDIYEFIKNTSETIKNADPGHLISLGTIGGIGDKFGNSFSRFSMSNFENLYSIKTLDAVSLHDYSFGSTLFERVDIYNRLKGNHSSSDLYSSLSDLVNYFPESIDKLTLKHFNKTFDFPLTLRSLWKRYNRMNIAAAKRLNKPVYIGEVGFKKSLKEMRKIVLEKELREYFINGVSGVLLWSFESQGRSLDGHDYGFDLKDGFGEIVKRISLEN